MKNKLLAFVLTVVISLAPITIYAEENTLDDLFYAYTFDGPSGCALIGSYIENGKLIVLLTYYNGSNGNNYPATAFKVNAFQDGIQLQKSYIFYKLSGFESASTQIQPGATINYYEVFEPRSISPVEIQLSKYIDFSGSSMASYTFAYDDLVNWNVISKTAHTETETETETEIKLLGTETEASDPDWEQMYNDLLVEYNSLKDKYIALLESKE